MLTTADEKYPSEPPPDYSTTVSGTSASTTVHRPSDEKQVLCQPTGDQKHGLSQPTRPLAAGPSYEIRSNSLSSDFLEIRAAGSPTIDYLCRTPHAWSLSKPNVMLHAGADQTAPVVAAGRLRSVHHPVIGLGNPAQGPHAVEWETLKQHWTWRGRYTFAARVGGERRAYAWEPVRGTGSWRATLGATFRLVDQGTGATVATLSATYGWEIVKAGTLRFEAPVPPELERWALISCCMALVVTAVGTMAAAT